jgi:group I intron endonuclease
MNTTCGIYGIVSPSNKFYIGQSIKIEVRWLHYSSLDCIDQPKLYNSLLKYGVDNHKFLIIEECCIDLLNERERYWQEHYDVIKSGLNCKYVSTLEKSGPLSEETKIKISIANKGRINKRKNYKHSEETKRKISIANKGKSSNGFTGKHTNESKRKMSESKKGRVISKEHKLKLSIAAKGKPSKLKGRIFSEEERKRIYATRIGRKKNHINENK